ncbi:MAG: NAD(P)/FAD-dependent oxidoreductase [Ilumatobacteraceae bacterium]
MSALHDARTIPLWLDQLGTITVRPPITGDLDVDVAVVGGGFSGLWTAYYLSQLDPSLRIAVLERHHCGFGASGRNGGWAVGELAGSFAAYAERSSADESMRLSRAVFDAVDEIGRVSHAEGIDCHYAKGGWIRAARTGPQAARQRAEIAELRELGFTEDEMRLLGADEATKFMNATKTRSGIYFAPTAAIDPARLVRGLADVLERRGVTVAEQTQVLGIGDRTVTTTAGTVTADVVVRATEAYTRDLDGERRALLPVYSLMVATEPLPADVLDEIGLIDRPTFSDDRYMVIYGQRTADGRLAFGGRGVPYLFGSRIERSAELHAESHDLIRETLIDLFPVLSDVAFTHRWGGVLAIPRNWLPFVDYDRATGRAALGGYVGEGVAAANLAGRTLAELITGEHTDRTSLPWVAPAARRWEPEPFRWLGVRGSRRILAAADDREEKTDQEAKVATNLAHLLRGD